VTVTRKHRQGGREAAALVSRAEPDGRTLLLTNDVPGEAHSGSDAALWPVASIAGMPYVLVAAHDSKHADLAELIRDARSAERTFVATAGGRGAAHHALVRLRERHGLRIEPVAYNGGNAALQAVVTKQPPTAFVPLPAVLPYASGGRLKILAIADSRRHPSIPHVQTGGEGGLLDFEAVGWFGLFAPSGTSRSVLRDLDAMLARGPQSEPTRQTFEGLGLRLEHRTADAFAELLLRSAHGGRKTGGRGAT
jgi:tripartite-type tricarboxylate transporter receptor subunit TctC